ncbi:ABC transporter [Salipaludibacillus neizhouensis]|uniref:ABC transporter n=1 Tax=Salipaludibacillus neizhouensis TaxID=885475 RepID=A0A3A9K5J4_9BACI|nr:ABC transporter ATP-binding protein [Salipaludibacillus neizhouensis]RKL64953.1 ABC transporter [Salipaludibacillus neizhouensis]
MKTNAKISQKNNGLLSVYLWCLSFIWTYKWRLCFLILTGIIVTGTQLVVPKLIQFSIDHIFPNKDYLLFIYLLILFLILLIIMFVTATVQNWLKRTLQEYASRDLHLSIIKQIRLLGFSYYERHPIGETLAFINTELTAIQELYRILFPRMVRLIIFSIIAVIMMMSINIKLTLISSLSLLLYYFIGPYFEKKTAMLSKSLANNRVEESKKVYESISGINELRINSAEEWDLSNYLKTLKLLNMNMISMYWYAYWRASVRRFSYYSGGIVLIIYGTFLIQGNTLTIGEFVGFLLYYFSSMQMITNVITVITEQKVLLYQAKKIFDFMQTTAEITNPTSPIKLSEIKGEIEFRNVSFYYTDNLKVLNKIDLRISPGEKIALVGASGSGKTTMLKLIGRFYDPQEGEIIIDSVPLKKVSLFQLRESLGYVFQETFLFGSTVKENILFGNPHASDDMVYKAAKVSLAHEFIMELPHQYDTPLGERGVRLSGGQKQRIAIARMVLKDPPVILLDEATSALDNNTESEVQIAFDNLLKGRTTIAIAHSRETIKKFEKLVVINNGIIVEKGSYNDLIAKKRYFYNLMNNEVEHEIL